MSQRCLHLQNLLYLAFASSSLSPRHIASNKQSYFVSTFLCFLTILNGRLASMAANLYFSSSWVFRLYAIAIAPILLVLLRNSFSSLANPEESRLSLWILIGVVAFFGWKGFINYYCHGLHRYPGPILAKFTKLWHLLDVNRNSHQLSMIELHRKNGPVIRIGPNTLSISDPRYIPQIYGVSVSFPKVGRQ